MGRSRKTSVTVKNGSGRSSAANVASGRVRPLQNLGYYYTGAGPNNRIDRCHGRGRATAKRLTLSTATATKEVVNCPHATDANDQQWSCDVPVSVAGLTTLPADFTLEVDVPTNQVEKGAQFKVIYDPNNPEKTLTTGIITSAGRSGVEVILGVVLALAVLFFVLNWIFRRNRTWQNVQGVFQGVDLAHGLLQR